MNFKKDIRKIDVFLILLAFIGIFIIPSVIIDLNQRDNKESGIPISQSVTYKDINFWISDLYLDGDNLYCTCDDEGFGIIPINSQGVLGTPKNIMLYGKINPISYDEEEDYVLTHKIFVKNNYAYVTLSGYSGSTGGFRGFSIVDISDPSDPEEITFVEISADNVEGIVVDEDYAYIAAYDDGLYIVNISDPLNTGVPDQLTLSINARNIFYDNNFTYVVGFGGFVSINMTDPENPGTPTYETIYVGYSLSVQGDYAYIADYNKGIKIIDISDPNDPNLINSFYTKNNAYDVDISGNYLFVADDEAGITVFNIEDPLNPTINKTKNIKRDVIILQVSTNYAYMNAGDKGIGIVDISNPNTLGDEDILPSNAVLVKQLDESIGGTVYIDFICSDGGCSTSKQEATWLIADVTIYNVGETSARIQVEFSSHSYGGGEEWTYNFKVKDKKGNILATYENNQLEDFWEDDVILLTVTQQKGYVFELNYDFEYQCCVDCSTFWNVQTQTLIITCYEWKTQVDSQTFAATYNELNMNLIYIGSAAGGIMVVGGGIVIKKKKGSGIGGSYSSSKTYKSKKNYTPDWNSIDKSSKDDSGFDFGSDSDDLFEF